LVLWSFTFWLFSYGSSLFPEDLFSDVRWDLLPEKRALLDTPCRVGSSFPPGPDITGHRDLFVFLRDEVTTVFPPFLSLPSRCENGENQLTFNDINFLVTFPET